MSTVSFVYFDLGDVVVSSRQAHEAIAKLSTSSLEEIEAFLAETEQQRGRGHVATDAYMADLKKRVGLAHAANDFTDMWSDFITPILPTHDLIRELAAKYRLGILSNAELGVIEKELIKGKIPNIPWTVIIESAAEGYMKPDKEIFELAQHRAGVPAEEIFFIDDKKANTDAAAALGWQTFLFDSKNLEAHISKLRSLLLE